MVQRRHPTRYFAFDLVSLNGENLTKLPLLARTGKFLAVPVSLRPLCRPFAWQWDRALTAKKEGGALFSSEPDDSAPQAGTHSMEARRE
jgi:hypothetical protein